MQESDLSITTLIARVKADDESAANALCRQLFHRLASFANQKLGGLTRHVDGEDIAISCLDRLCRKLKDGQYPDLSNHSELWSLLVRMAEQKSIDRRRKLMSQKQGGGKNTSETIFIVREQDMADLAVDIREPKPEDIVALEESLQLLLSRLPSEELRETVLARLSGESIQEIADRLEKSARTIQLRLQTIAEDWAEAL